MIAGTLVVHRARGGWRDRLRAYRILVDGAEVGSVRAGASVSAVADAGVHRVEGRLGRCRGGPLEVRLAPGEVRHVVCRARGGLLAALTRSGDCIDLVETGGPPASS